MGRLRALIPFVLALFIAGLGSMFIYNWVQEQTAVAPERMTEEVPRERQDIGEVVVALTDVAAGTRLADLQLTTREYLLKNLPQGHFRDVSEVAGRVTIAPMKANEPIIEHRLAPIDIRTGGVSALLQEGRRAVAVGGDKVIGISGFIHPGNRVDVLVTWKDQEIDQDITKIVLENVRVLATGTVMQETEKGGTAPVDVYTLELTPEETEILTHVRNQGRLQFALRNPMDGDTVVTMGTTFKDAMLYLVPEDLRRVAEAPPAPAPVRVPRPAAPPPPPEIVVQVIEGGRLVEKKFKD